VNIYTKDWTFQRVANPYCRILDSTDTELARYELKEAGNQNGLIIARLFREGEGIRWGFQAIGSFCRGNTWKDSAPAVSQLCRKTPRELQLRGASSVSLAGSGDFGGGGGDAHAPAPAAAPPPPKSAACVLL